MRREWLHRVTKSLETIRRGMQHSCSLSNPAHDDFALTITEPHNPPGKASRKRFLHLFERQLRQRLAFKRAGPTRKRLRWRARCGRFKTRSRKRRQCRYHTRDYVVDVVDPTSKQRARRTTATRPKTRSPVNQELLAARCSKHGLFEQRVATEGHPYSCAG